MKSKKFRKFVKCLGTIMILKARGVRKSLFCVSAPKETENISISLAHIGQAIYYRVFSHFHLYPDSRKDLEGKTYPAMDSPVHGESDDVTLVLVEDCIHKL